MAMRGTSSNFGRRVPARAVKVRAVIAFPASATSKELFAETKP